MTMKSLHQAFIIILFNALLLHLRGIGRGDKPMECFNFEA